MVVRHRLPAFAFWVVLLLAACAPSPTGAPAGDTKAPAGGTKAPAGGTKAPAGGTKADAVAPGAVRARFTGFAGGPGFTLPNDLRGRPLVLNAWASWCGPCRKEMPEFQRVYLEIRDTVGFLGVDYLDQVGAAKRLVAETGVTYPLAADPKGTELAKLGLAGLPTTFFISADGLLRGRQAGEMTAETLRRAIRTYLSEAGP